MYILGGSHRDIFWEGGIDSEWGGGSDIRGVPIIYPGIDSRGGTLGCYTGT